MSQKIKVVWICEFSNPEVRSLLDLKANPIEIMIRRITKRKLMLNYDYGVWNTNAIREVEKYPEIELHVISPQHHLKGGLQRFCNRNVHYYFYKNEQATLRGKVVRYFKHKNPEFTKNRRIIKQLVADIQPDIIHLIGGENPHYSLSVLDIPTTIPIILQLQTLVNDPAFIEKYPNYNKYNIECEKKVIERVDYIGCSKQDEVLKNIIEKTIHPKAEFLDLELANGAVIDRSEYDKKYDLVYFSANINKAFDLALEGYAVAHQKHPEITLDVIGHFDIDYKERIDKRISELGLGDSINFEGHQDTHDDVINLVKKCRIALLPLKFDLLSTTIREAMALGLPVVSTITDGTPALNEKRRSILLSEIGDQEQLGKNICALLEDNKLVGQLRDNGFETMQELYDNKKSIAAWVKAYKDIIS